MSFDATIGAFAAALDDPSAAGPAYDPRAHGRARRPALRRLSEHVAVGLIGALEARYPVSRGIAGEDLFRAMARAFVRARKPRSPVMIAYGAEFPEFVAGYLAGNPATDGRVSSPQSPSNGRASFGRPMAGEEQGGGSRRSIRQAGSLRGLIDVARLENAWVEAYHAEDAGVATVADLAALSPDRLPGTRIAFHPAARLLRFATAAASIWASAQKPDQPAALTEEPGRGRAHHPSRLRCARARPAAACL